MKKKDLFGRDRLAKFDKRFPSRFPTDKEIPAVIVLKRKAIRVYPDHQKIALYYTQALDKYVSIPFGPNNTNLGVQFNEARKPTQLPFQSTLDSLKNAGYDTIAADYENYHKTGKDTTEKALKRIALKRISEPGGLKGILSLPAHERDALLPHVINKIKTSDLSVAGKLGALHGIKLKKMLTKPAPTKPKEAPDPMAPLTKPSPITESFKTRVKTLREQQQLDEWGTIIPTVARLIAGTAAGEAVIAAGKAGLKRYGAPAMEWAGKQGRAIKDKISKMRSDRATRNAAEKEANPDWAKSMRNNGKSRGKNKYREGGKGLSKADKALIGTDILTGIGAAAGDAANKASQQSQKDYGFSPEGRAQPRVAGPNSRVVADPNEVRTARQSMGLPMYNREETESNLNTIRQIVENNIKHQDLVFGDRTISLNNSVAKKVLKLYESLNKQNKKKVEQMLNEDVTSFRKVINFAIRQ